MKIFIYIIFFGIFLVISVLVCGLLIRSISFLVSSFRLLKSKFTIKNSLVFGEQGHGKEIKVDEIIEKMEKSEEMESI